MTLVYFDNCAIQRPLDDRDQFRIRAEADAVTAILAAVENGAVGLITSSALRAESSRVRNQSRLDFAQSTLALASHEAPISPDVVVSVQIYKDAGMKPFDALHLALAVGASADYFCTTDDRLLRRGREANTRTTRVVSPLELAAALDL